MADLVSPSRTYGLVDILDRVLDKGLVVVGDIKINLANVELLTIQIRLLICSIDKAEQIGMDWWRTDPRLQHSGSQHLQPSRSPNTPPRHQDHRSHDMAVERSPSGSSLIDVLDRVLDKGIVIDAWVRVSLVGIDLVTVEARIVVASIETYLKYSEAVGLAAARLPPVASSARVVTDELDRMRIGKCGSEAAT